MCGHFCLSIEGLGLLCVEFVTPYNHLHMCWLCDVQDELLFSTLFHYLSLLGVLMVSVAVMYIRRRSLLAECRRPVCRHELCVCARWCCYQLLSSLTSSYDILPSPRGLAFREAVAGGTFAAPCQPSSFSIGWPAPLLPRRPPRRRPQSPVAPPPRRPPCRLPCRLPQPLPPQHSPTTSTHAHIVHQHSQPRIARSIQTYASWVANPQSQFNRVTST